MPRVITTCGANHVPGGVSQSLGSAATELSVGRGSREKKGDFVGKSQVVPWENTKELNGNLNILKWRFLCGKINSDMEVSSWEDQRSKDYNW